jgi:predicted O-methyltransferase YrrM
MVTIADNFVLAAATDRPRRVRFVNSVLAFAERERLHEGFPTVGTPAQIASTPGIDVVLKPAVERPGYVAFAELCVLAALVRSSGARRVFEFGTFDGNTSYHFALNTPADGLVFTVDIPSGVVPRLRTDKGDALFHPGEGIGYRWEGTSVAHKIQAIQSDSARLDIDLLVKSIDLVFIDGAHSAEYLKNDTALALRMARPGGMIVWHDYMVWNDVTTFLNALSLRHSLQHLAGTSLVVHTSPTQDLASTSLVVHTSPTQDLASTSLVVHTTPTQDLAGTSLVVHTTPTQDV